MSLTDCEELTSFHYKQTCNYAHLTTAKIFEKKL